MNESLTVKQYFDVLLDKSICNLNNLYAYMNKNLLKLENRNIEETAFKIFKSSFNSNALDILNESIKSNYNFDSDCRFTYHFLERLLTRFLNYDVDILFNQVNKLYRKVNRFYNSSKTKSIISICDDFVKIRYRPYEKVFITIIKPSKRSYKRTYIRYY